MMILGLDYTCMRSATAAQLENNESFYVSSHVVSIMMGVHL